MHKTESWLFEDLKSKNGSLVNGVRRERKLLEDGDLLELGHTFFSFRVVRGDAAELSPPLLPELTTLIPDIHRQFSRLGRASGTALSILLTGETGTGKEMLARAVHQLSRREGSFMAINCGALASSVLEVELFGVTKGAFTGAYRDRDGLIRAAHQGTLFLDEIGELPLASQSAFLRVLQEREVVPVGATQPIKVDFRLISATNRDLSALVARDAFRADLLSRISGFEVRVPSLRERREDLAILVPALIARHTKAGREPPRVTPTALRAMLLYAWPMNVRELEKCLEAAVALAEGAMIDVEDLPEAVRKASAISIARALLPAPIVMEPSDLKPSEEQQREELVGLLRSHRGNVSEVARALGKARNQVVRWMKRYSIEAQRFR
jgi:transcriptional regulator with PAS, ATPase and Fis domain